MSRISWFKSLFGASSKAASTISRKRPAGSPIKLEFLEDRTAPAVALDWSPHDLASIMTADATNVQTLAIENAATPPQVTGVTLNGGEAAAALGGSQHSRVVNVEVAFDQPVVLDANALALSLHTNNVSYGGVAQPSGMGAIPTLVVTPNGDYTAWTLTFAGANTEGGSIDGFASLVDGVYDVTVDATKVHPVGDMSQSMAADSTTTFARLFGETVNPSSESSGASTDFNAVVNSGDNLAFRTAFNNDAAYRADLDFDGNGAINTGDNLEFRRRFNKNLTWSESNTEVTAADGVDAPALSLNSAVVPPRIVSVTPNGGLAADALGGAQHSRIVNFEVAFDQPVQLDTDAMVLALHTNNVAYVGVAQPAGMGALPTLVLTSNAEKTIWTVTFAGENAEVGADGFASLVDGVYDLTIDAAKVHAIGDDSVRMSENATATFARVFGETAAPLGTANGDATDFTAVVNSGDNLAFRTAFNNAAAYNASLDFNGDGTINSADNLAFRTRFNKFLTWTV